MFLTNDKCDPHIFPECTGCPRAQCVYHGLEHSGVHAGLQVFNILAVIWLTKLCQSFSAMVVTEVFGQRYWTHTHSGVLTAVKTTFRNHLEAVMVGSCTPMVSCHSGTYVMVSVHGHSFFTARRKCLAFLSKHSKRVQSVQKASKLIILTQKLFTAGLVTLIFYTLHVLIFSSVHQIWIETFSLNICFILALLAVSWNVLTVYDIGVSILLLFNAANTGRVEEEDDEIFDAKFLKTLHKNREDIELEYNHVYMLSFGKLI